MILRPATLLAQRVMQIIAKFTNPYRVSMSVIKVSHTAKGGRPSLFSTQAAVSSVERLRGRPSLMSTQASVSSVERLRGRPSLLSTQAVISTVERVSTP